jgi:hypothetical protein
MNREEAMWKAVEEEHGPLSQREAFVTLTALEWADKTLIDKAYEWAEKRFDLDYCGDVRELLDYLISLAEEKQ